MRFELDNDFWEKNFCADEPDASPDASWQPFSREDVQSIIEMSIPEEDDPMPTFFMAGILHDGRYFYMEGPDRKICHVANGAMDLYDFGMTELGKVFLPKVLDHALESEEAKNRFRPKATIYFSNERRAALFEQFWIIFGHQAFQNFLNENEQKE